MFKKPLWQTVWTQIRLLLYSGSTPFASIHNLSVMLGNYLQQTTSAKDIFRCIFFLGALGLINMYDPRHLAFSVIRPKKQGVCIYMPDLPVENRFHTLHAGKFTCFFCRLLFFFKINIFEKFFQKYHQSVKQ